MVAILLPTNGAVPLTFCGHDNSCWVEKLVTQAKNFNRENKFFVHQCWTHQQRKVNRKLIFGSEIRKVQKLEMHRKNLKKIIEP